MTAVDVDALDKLREALHRSVCDEIPDGGTTCDELADALLPVVDLIANERAAAELRAAAKAIRWDGLLQASDYAGYAAQLVDVRADELDLT